MTTRVSYTGKDLKDMLAAATQWLEKSASDIDALNVFPVPDGDTGTNMLLTMRSTLDEIGRAADSRLGSVATAVSRGSLMGARGNSGVILSQILRGLAEALQRKHAFTGRDVAEGLKEGVGLAYNSIARPVEGTMLTVVRDVAAAAGQASQADHYSLLPVLQAAVSAARDSVARTPDLLPVLRQACVVDAGGQGLYVLLEGMLLFRRGELKSKLSGKPQVILPLETCVPVAPVEEDEKPYGYCTELLVNGEGLSAETIRQKLEKKGESLIVVGDHNAVKVHIHTYRPGDVLNLATRLGTVHDVLIRNMDDQHREYREYLEKRQESRAPAGGSSMRPADRVPRPAGVATLSIAAVAVVSGEGLARVFRSLGAVAIVPGGATMNPSTQQLLEAIEAARSEKVVLLTNNRNVVPAAQQAQTLASKQVVVVPTETVPQGIAALLAFNPEADMEANGEAMEAARSSVKTAALTHAVRPTECCGRRIEQGQAISLVDDALVGAGNTLAEALEQAMAMLDVARAEAITIYSGEGASPAETSLVEAVLRRHAPGAQMELVDGGQPHYPYIISVE
ncbi:MAG: DAK2 domain-containing protein [Chloroflexi bacterium]|nr:DAK2 domain-containing protein [Chloroflexota bacterium]